MGGISSLFCARPRRRMNGLQAEQDALKRSLLSRAAPRTARITRKTPNDIGLPRTGPAESARQKRPVQLGELVGERIQSAILELVHAVAYAGTRSLDPLQG